MPEPSNVRELQELVAGDRSLDAEVFKIPESRGVLREAVRIDGGEQCQDFNEELIRWFEGDVGFGSVNPPSQNERAVMEERLVFVWVVDYVVVDFLGEPRNDRSGSAQLSSAPKRRPIGTLAFAALAKKKTFQPSPVQGLTHVHFPHLYFVNVIGSSTPHYCREKCSLGSSALPPSVLVERTDDHYVEDPPAHYYTDSWTSPIRPPR